MIKSKHIAEALHRLKKENVPEEIIAKNFSEFVHKNNMIHSVSHILRHLEIKQDIEKERSTCKITSSHQLSSELVTEIKKFGNAQFQPHQTVEDKELLGGFVMKSGGKIYDASLKTQLEILKRTLIKN